MSFKQLFLLTNKGRIKMKYWITAVMKDGSKWHYSIKRDIGLSPELMKMAEGFIIELYRDLNKDFPEFDEVDCQICT